VVIIERRAVLDAEAEMTALIERLSNEDPVTIQGMAMAERIVTDSESSPLYNAAEPGTLRRRVLVATAALEPESRPGHRLPLAA
jgi:hypothetical protein